MPQMILPGNRWCGQVFAALITQWVNGTVHDTIHFTTLHILGAVHKSCQPKWGVRPPPTPLSANVSICRNHMCCKSSNTL